MSAHMYVDGLASSVTRDVLITLFSGCGTVRSIQILPKMNGESLGIAKVQMGSAEEADRAIQVMNKTILNGRVLVVFKEPETNAKLQGGG
jgi:RNA recognition motif-containing protein